MVKLLIQKGVYCYDLPDHIIEKIEKDLTFDNPQYLSAMKYGRFVGASTPPTLEYYSHSPHGDNIVKVPKGYIWNVRKMLSDAGIDSEIDDHSLTFEKCNFEFSGKMRNYQALAIKDLMKYPVGVLEASTGSGKTVMGLKMIQLRQQPTLILVHNKELFYQWRDRIKQFIGYDAGMYGDGLKIKRDITIGIVNTVNKNIDDLALEFGFIIVDECHRCPSTLFTTTLVNFPARYQLGLSATAFRNDGLDGLIPAFLGPVKHKVSKQHLQKTGAVLVPEVHRIETNFRYNYRQDYSKMMSALVTDDNRNKVIAKTVINDFRKHKNCTLIVSDRVHHCSILKAFLVNNGIKAEVLTAKIKADERHAIVDKVRRGEVDVLISTLSLIAEGFDAPNLHALFLATPVKFEGRILQVAGRVLRPEEGKTARVYDFRDANIWPLRKQAQERDKVYKSEWDK